MSTHEHAWKFFSATPRGEFYVCACGWGRTLKADGSEVLWPGRPESRCPRCNAPGDPECPMCDK